MEKELQYPQNVYEDLLVDRVHLTLFNDDFNTFDHVIESLITVCRHEAIQAEQCAFTVHYKGKCVVKSGGYEELSMMHRSLSERNLTVEINN